LGWSLRGGQDRKLAATARHAKSYLDSKAYGYKIFMPVADGFSQAFYTA
jgi:hypothetical protein